MNKQSIMTYLILTSSASWATDSQIRDDNNFPRSTCKRSSTMQYEMREAPQDADAQSKLGERYEKEGIYNYAGYWYYEAARQGHALSQFKVGELYELGRGIPKNDKQAIFWLEMAAKNGNIQAQNNLKARYLKQKLRAEQGGRKAQYSFGVMNEKWLFPPNYEEADKWYLLAAKKGHASAQFQIARKNECGEDAQRAVKWYRRAAKNGLSQAQFILGERFETGTGVKKSITKATKWYRRAADQNHEGAQVRLTRSPIKEKLADLKYYEWVRENTPEPVFW